MLDFRKDANQELKDSFSTFWKRWRNEGAEEIIEMKVRLQDGSIITLSSNQQQQPPTEPGEPAKDFPPLYEFHHHLPFFKRLFAEAKETQWWFTMRGVWDDSQGGAEAAINDILAGHWDNPEDVSDGQRAFGYLLWRKYRNWKRNSQKQRTFA